MSWLKTAGQFLATGVGIVAKIEGFEPFIDPLIRGLLPKTSTAQNYVTTVENDLTKIGGVVTTVECVITASGLQATGGDKLKAAAPLVMEIVQGSEMLAGKKIKDQAAFEKACQGITSNVADLLNALEAPSKP